MSVKIYIDQTFVLNFIFSSSGELAQVQQLPQQACFVSTHKILKQMRKKCLQFAHSTNTKAIFRLSKSRARMVYSQASADGFVTLKARIFARYVLARRTEFVQVCCGLTHKIRSVWKTSQSIRSNTLILIIGCLWITFLSNLQRFLRIVTHPNFEAPIPTRPRTLQSTLTVLVLCTSAAYWKRLSTKFHSISVKIRHATKGFGAFLRIIIFWTEKINRRGRSVSDSCTQDLWSQSWFCK